jgi:hypothetical protein
MRCIGEGRSHSSTGSAVRAVKSLFPLREPITATAMSGRPADQPFADFPQVAEWRE